MPRVARVVVTGVPHLVTQRGNRSEEVFFTAKDRRRHLELLGRYAAERRLGILGLLLDDQPRSPAPPEL